MSDLKSETEPGTGSRKRNLVFLLILIAGFSVIWCFGYFTGRAIKAGFMDSETDTAPQSHRKF